MLGGVTIIKKNLDIREYCASKLKEYRQTQGLTQQDLAQKLTNYKIKRKDKTPITRATISKYENGKLAINPDTLYDLSKILNITIDKFFPGYETEEIIYNDKEGYTITLPNFNDKKFEELSNEEKNDILDQAIYELSKLKLEIKNKN